MPKSFLPGPTKPGTYTPDTRTRLQHATRFFARLESFSLECPKCGRVYIIQVRGHGKHWDPESARFTCSNKHCGRVYILGMVAWPVAQLGGGATPEDQVPSPRQLAQLRKDGGGWWLADEAKITTTRPRETNLTLEEDRPQQEEEEEDEDGN